jgi:hypothetical protein
VTFKWNGATDPDADPLSYSLFVCSEDTYPDACSTPVVTLPSAVSQGAAAYKYVGSGVGLFLFGAVFTGMLGRRRKVSSFHALLVVVMMLSLLVLPGCGQLPGDGWWLNSQFEATFSFSGESGDTTVILWKVEATDGIYTTSSGLRSFELRLP